MANIAGNIEGVKLESPNKFYSDIKHNHWAINSIMDATARGFLTGIDDNRYAPNNTLNYADTFTAINRVLMRNNQLKIKNTRDEVKKLTEGMSVDHWAHYNFMSVLSKMSNPIKLDDSVYRKSMTRYDLAENLYNLLKDYDIPANRMMIAYNDISNPNAIVQFVGNTGIMIGDNKNNFNGGQVLTRAELASVLIRIDNLIK